MLKKLAVVSTVAALIAPAALATGPHLAVTDTSPFTVHGAGFIPHETVHVVVSASTAYRSTTVASARGRFVVLLRHVTPGTCGSYVVRATGSRGSRATFRHFVPDCAPGPAP